MVISMSTTEKLSCKANITTNRLNNAPPFGVSTREEEPIAFTTEMTPKVDGGYSVLPTQQRLQGRTMYSGTDKWKRSSKA